MERESGRGPPGPSRWGENRLKQPGTCSQAENLALACWGGPGLFTFSVYIFLYFVIRTMCKKAYKLHMTFHRSVLTTHFRENTAIKSTKTPCVPLV